MLVLRTLLPVLLAAALVGAAGCGGGGGGSTTSPSQTATDFDFGANDPRKVTAFGDSLTAGFLGLKRRDFRLTTVNNYPNRLMNLLQSLDPAWRVVNRGVGGEDSTEGAQRFPGVLAADRPGFVLVMEGTNDAHQCRNSDVLFANLQRMVGLARASKAIPILGTIAPSFRNNPCADDIIAEVNGALRGFAAAEHVVLADIFNGMNDRTLFGLSPVEDPLHPNEQGYEVMASIWYSALLQALPGGATGALRRRR
jgi:lysophospholipase L1-like esterase